MVPTQIKVMNATIPAKFQSLNIDLYWSGYEWWKAFNNQSGDFWNAGTSYVPNYLKIIFNDTYLLTSFQLTLYGDTTHDAKYVDYYYDENATCLAERFNFSVPPSYWYTFPTRAFNYLEKPIVRKEILLNFTRGSVYQLWLPELTLFGIPY